VVHGQNCLLLLEHVCPLLGGVLDWHDLSVLVLLLLDESLDLVEHTQLVWQTDVSLGHGSQNVQLFAQQDGEFITFDTLLLVGGLEDTLVLHLLLDNLQQVLEDLWLFVLGNSLLESMGPEQVDDSLDCVQ